MSCACKEENYDHKVIVSEATYKYAENKISFKPFGYRKFKGKSVELPIFLPLDKPDEYIR